MAEFYISVGKLGKPHGISGAFRFLLHRELKKLQKLPRYFIFSPSNNPVPRFINKVEWITDKEGLITFEDVTNPENAKQLSGSELYLIEKDFTKWFISDEGELDFLKGYLVLDEEGNAVGYIEEIIEHPGQSLLTIQNKDVLIPFVEDWVLKLNKRKKEITFRLPEGLLDL